MRDAILTSARFDVAERSGPVAVVTRPAPDHASLTRALDARKLRWLHAPAFALHEYADNDSRLEALAGCDLVLVTSPATARIVAGHGAPSTAANVRWIAPGAGTAGVLRAAGIDARTPGSGGTSEDVLTLPELNNVGDREIAIVGAPGGRETIGRELRRRGAEVKRIHVYERRPLPLAPALLEVLESGATAMVLVSSVLVIEHLFSAIPDALRPALRDCGFVVSSRRTEQACRRHHAHLVVRAKGAGTDELIEGLERLRAGHSEFNPDCS